MKILALALVAISALAVQAAQEPVTVKVVAKQYEFNPARITVKAGVPVILELTTADRVHGFSIPDLKLRTEIKPGETARLQFTPDKPGSYPFKCDVYCGAGHPSMKGVLVVE